MSAALKRMGPTTIRDETAGDHDAVRGLHRSAFADEPAVLRIVDDLRRSGEAAISLVAEHQMDIVGHLLFSRLAAPMRALSLAPLGVHPDFQKAGIGSALVRKGLERARQGEWQAVFVLGSPAYYGRFGFNAATAEGYTAPYWGWPFMALILDDSVPRTGQISYPDAFAEDIKQFPAFLETLKAP
jgi:putative acetyltransferase